MMSNSQKKKRKKENDFSDSFRLYEVLSVVLKK